MILFDVKYGYIMTQDYFLIVKDIVKFLVYIVISMFIEEFIFNQCFFKKYIYVSKFLIRLV